MTISVLRQQDTINLKISPIFALEPNWYEPVYTHTAHVLFYRVHERNAA